MNRILASVSAAALLASIVSAQCYETNLGVLAPRGANAPGVGDDVLFDPQPLNFAFPMGGVAASYTDAYFNSNGVIFLSNGVLAPLPTATGYSTTPATQLTNLQGTAGQPPRIAPLWRDLNMLAANGGGVYVNNTIPGKFVVTWLNAVQFGSTTPIFTVQAQLLASGEVDYFYSGTLASTSATIAGISSGNAIAATAGVNLSAGGNVSTTQLMFEQFAANTIDLANTSLTFTPTGGGYVQTTGACVPAFHQSYGTGCYSIPAQGFYESYADAAVASAALQGNAMQLSISGGSYVATWIPGGATSYVPPSGAAVSLPLTDDGDTVVMPTTPLTIPGGSEGMLTVSHNAIITLGNPGNSSGDFSPTGPELAAGVRGAFYSWHDWNDNEVGSGTIKTEEVGGVLYITWDGVENYASPSVLNPGTIQFQLNLATGTVTYVWVTIDTNTTSTFGSAHVIGYKGTGAITDPGSTVLSTSLPASFIHNQFLPLNLAAAPAPVSGGAPVVYTTSNMPEYAPGSGVHIGLLILSTNQAAAGIPLSLIGAPGCSAYVATLDLTQTMVGGATQTVSFAIPAGTPAGFEIYAQSVGLVVPNSLPNGQNTFGLVSSNGIRSVINSF